MEICISTTLPKLHIKREWSLGVVFISVYLQSIFIYLKWELLCTEVSIKGRVNPEWWYKSGRGFVLKHLWFIVEIRIQGLLLVKLDSTSMQNIGEKEHDCSSYTSTELSGKHRSCLVSTLKVFSKNIRLGLKVYFITVLSSWEVASGVEVGGLHVLPYMYIYWDV